MRVAFASRNAGKLRELRLLLPGWVIEPLDVAGIGEEVGETFYENARAKAAFAREIAPSGDWALGEDSGLEVDGLGGAPGVRSARFAGLAPTGEQNVRRLLEALRDHEGRARRARYVCELVLLSPQGEEVRGTGTLEGAIATESRGAGGFGYDPVFVADGEQLTVSELGDVWKARNSHRSRGARALERAVAALRLEAAPSDQSRPSGGAP